MSRCLPTPVQGASKWKVPGWTRLALILAVFSIACGGSPTQPSWDGQVRVVGSLRDFQTNAVIGGRRVTIGTATAVTDPGGLYSLTVPAGQHRVSVDDVPIAAVDMNDPTYRGDFYAPAVGCIARYGTVVDSLARRPVSGATVSVGGRTAASDQTGWFHVSLGCPGVPCIGINTTFLSISHPRYKTALFPAGRGVCAVQRVDYELKRR